MICIPDEQIEKAVGISPLASQLLLVYYSNPGQSLQYYGDRIGKHKYQVKRWLTAMGVTADVTEVCHVRDSEKTTYIDKCDGSVTADVTITRSPFSSPDGFPPHPPSLPPSFSPSTRMKNGRVCEDKDEKSEKPAHDPAAYAIVEQVYMAAGITRLPEPGHEKYQKLCEHIQTSAAMLKTHKPDKILWVARRALEKKDLRAWGNVVAFGKLPWIIDDYEKAWNESEIDRQKRIKLRQQEEEEKSRIICSDEEWKAGWDKVKKDIGLEVNCAAG